VERGDPLGVPAGEGTAPGIMHLWQVRDGRVVRFQPLIDNPAMLAALTPQAAA
jgi:hypothetical protein